MTTSALITGGSSGIGLATALALGRAGVAITIAGRRASALDEAAAAITAAGAPQVATVVADLASPDAPERIVDAHVTRFDGLDALVAAAGDYELVPADRLTAASWDATLDVHVRGAVLLASAAARHLDGHGRIVLLSSVNGLHSEPASAAYSAAKAAIISIARTLAVDLAGRGVSVNAVAPGWIRTPMTAPYIDGATREQLARVNPLSRVGTADEIAQVIKFLVLDAPSFLTGATIVVDGGQTAIAPMP